jgi:hypothetical protein
MTDVKGIAVDPSWNGLYKASGICLFIAGVIPFIFLILVIGLGQTIPIPAQETLEDPSVPTYLFLLAALGELLLMPGGLGFYLTLKDIRKSVVLFGVAIWFLATLMFLVSRGLVLALSQISSSYLSSTNEMMKAAYLASAELAIETQSMFAYMGLILLSVASIIIGSVMLKGVYGKVLGYVVIAAGIVTLFTPLGVLIALPFIINFIGVVLSAIWQITAGVKLYKLGA